MLSNMKQIVMPWARGAKHALRKRLAERRISDKSTGASPSQSVRTAFVIGCGRSGTTLVGEILARHADVKYFFEPYHLWATIDPTTDVLNRHHVGPCKFLLDEHHVDAETKRRFDRLFIDSARRAGVSLMIEKTPFNALRIGYMEGLAPGTRFLHLVRDGIDVCRSIDRISNDKTFRIIGMPGLNRWWGRDESKWKALSADGTAAGYFSQEVPLLKNYEVKGAYEWLVTLEEIDRWRPRLGDRLLEMTYDQLTSDPRGGLKKICEFLGLAMPKDWFEAAVQKIDKPRRNDGGSLVLPPKMCEAFNWMQTRFDFPGRAVAGEPQHNNATLQTA
jgi:hypothetical protein